MGERFKLVATILCLVALTSPGASAGTKGQPEPVEITNDPLRVEVSTLPSEPLGERIVLVRNLPVTTPVGTRTYTPSLNVTRYKTLFIYAYLSASDGAKIRVHPEFRTDPSDPFAGIFESDPIPALLLDVADQGGVQGQVLQLPVFGTELRFSLLKLLVPNTQATIIIYGIPR